MKVTIAGAPSTGKSPLAAALGHALQASGRQAMVTVATPPFAADISSDDLVLLTGLEPASQAQSAAASQVASQEAADQAIRAALAAAGVSYRVMYGTVEQRLAQALDAVNPPPPSLQPAIAARSAGKKSAWTWVCDKCSDPVCEHRLLSDLLAQRANSISA